MKTEFSAFGKALSLAVFLVVSLVVIAGLASCGQSLGGLDSEKKISLASNDMTGPPIDPENDSFNNYRVNSGDKIDLIFKFDDARPTEYTIRPGDTVEFKVFSLPEWSSRQRVLPNGTISLPYIGQFNLLDHTLESATTELRGKYTGILKDPSVFLAVIDYESPTEGLRESVRSSVTGQGRSITVQPDGKFSMPLLGTILARGMPFETLREKIITRYKQEMDVDTDVVLVETQGHMVYVIGAVLRPGSYPIFSPISVMQSLSLGGELSKEANLSRVILIRRIGDTMVCTPIDVNATLEGKDSSGMTPIQGGDIVFVPRTWLSSAGQVADEISKVTFFRGYSFSMGWSWSDWIRGTSDQGSGP